MYHIFACSESTGHTVDLASKVALAQFSDVQSEIHLRPGVGSFEDIDEIVNQAEQCKGLIIHSFVKHEFSEHVFYQGRNHNVEVINLLGPILNRFSHFLGAMPAEEPGMFSKLNQGYFRRIETTEFAIKHDDGANLDELGDAELVLLGVSRTFKTPLSIYLAFRGWMVANVPIVLDMPLPEILHKIPPERIICLKTNATSLSRLRNVRNEHLHGKAGNYASYDYVKREINYANFLFSQNQQWSVAWVTARPIEEIARNIISIYRKNEKLKPGSPKMMSIDPVDHDSGLELDDHNDLTK
ncbi:MAG: kinase/pyrophosphorylase [Bacteroidales bacterium]|nr:kinase/pyrophosphorylase [Bacteroidales bacterium]